MAVRLTDRQRAFLLAAAKAASAKTGVFQWAGVGKRVGFSKEESERIVEQLEDKGIVERLGDAPAIVTLAGRELVERLVGAT